MNTLYESATYQYIIIFMSLEKNFQITLPKFYHFVNNEQHNIKIKITMIVAKLNKIG